MPGQKTPAIHFKGFTGDWEQRKLGELVTIERGGSPRPIDAYITDAQDGLNWVKIGDAPEQGRYITQTEEKIKPSGLSKTRQVFPGDLILSNSMSFGKPYIMGIPGCIHDGWLLIRNNQNVFDLKFLCQMLGTEQMLTQYRKLAAGSTVNNLNKELVSNAVVTVPGKAEQEKIGVFLENLDDTITLHQRAYEKLQVLKKSMLENCFPKNGEKVPRLRFSGFTGDWEQHKLSELVERYEDPVETPHNGYTRLGIKSHAKGTFHEYVEPGHELETAKMHRVAANKLIFNITFAWEHAVAITDEDDDGKLVSHRFPQFTLSDSLRPEFLKYVILDEKFHHNLYLASPGGAGRNRVLKIDEALDYSIYYPSVDEQHKIGTFFDKLTDLITLHQRKLEKLKQVKQSMLEKMFV